MALFEPVLAALNERGVRYVIVGGVATVLHGHARLTADLDLVVDLAPEQARAAIDALVGLGLRARLPVDPASFADADTRRRWVKERNLTVFTLHDPGNPLLEVDLFADPPVPFDELCERSVTMRLGHLAVQVAAIEDLITMKRLAGRPQDLTDIVALEELRSP